MSLSSIRAKIKTYIQSATSLSNTVYDHEKLSTSMAKQKELFEENEILHTWDIKRTALSREHQAGHGGVEYVIHTFQIRGYYRYNDTLSSETAFSDTIVENVSKKFIDNPKLDGEALIIDMPVDGIITEEMFCGILCHKCILTVKIKERRTF